MRDGSSGGGRGRQIQAGTYTGLVEAITYSQPFILLHLVGTPPFSHKFKFQLYLILSSKLIVLGFLSGSKQSMDIQMYIYNNL